MSFLFGAPLGERQDGRDREQVHRDALKVAGRGAAGQGLRQWRRSVAQADERATRDASPTVVLET